jgi:pimeloyl-ACP methyl ester carboxylesterase
MQIFFRMARILIFRDPAGYGEGSFGPGMSPKDKDLFTRREFSDVMVEALRQGVKGWSREYTLERLDWPFELDDIHAPKVLVFHGEDDTGVHPLTADYMSMRIPSCDKAIIYPGEGHSVVYYRFQEIVQAMLEVWE